MPIFRFKQEHIASTEPFVYSTVVSMNPPPPHPHHFDEFRNQISISTAKTKYLGQLTTMPNLRFYNQILAYPI